MDGWVFGMERVPWFDYRSLRAPTRLRAELWEGFWGTVVVAFLAAVALLGVSLTQELNPVVRGLSVFTLMVGALAIINVLDRVIFGGPATAGDVKTLTGSVEGMRGELQSVGRSLRRLLDREQAGHQGTQQMLQTLIGQQQAGQQALQQTLQGMAGQQRADQQATQQALQTLIGLQQATQESLHTLVVKQDETVNAVRELTVAVQAAIVDRAPPT